MTDGRCACWCGCKQKLGEDWSVIRRSGAAKTICAECARDIEAVELA